MLSTTNPFLSTINPFFHDIKTLVKINSMDAKNKDSIEFATKVITDMWEALSKEEQKFLCSSSFEKFKAFFAKVMRRSYLNLPIGAVIHLKTSDATTADSLSISIQKKWDLIGCGILRHRDVFLKKEAPVSAKDSTSDRPIVFKMVFYAREEELKW